MKAFMNWLENSFAPKLQKVTNLTWIVVIKDSILQILPFILAGSLFCCLAILKGDFWTPFGWTMSKISLMIAFLVPFNYCEKKRYRKQRILAGISGLLLFMIFVEPEVVASGAATQGQSLYGAAGLFVAMIAGIVSGLIFGAFAKFSFFKEDSVIPDFVRQWFDALLPIMIVVALGWVLVDIVGLDIAGTIQKIFSPLALIANTLPGMMLVTFFQCFIYSMGISGWVLTPVTDPVKRQAQEANLALVAAGTATAQNLSLFTETTMYTCYMWIGGIGATLSLVLLMCFSKSKELNALGKACLAPGILNINEPVVFGAIAWNPYLMIPMWIQGPVAALTTWAFTKWIPIAKIPRIMFELWYCPYPISTWISTEGHLMSIVFVLCQFALQALIWYPFFKAYEKVKLAEEAEEAAK
ncbi:MAG: PTS sugar transporter subunit IIC [Erysipelotrichaceae bacterium]|nr:PTS sugar transporter subunit IIC [Erysipelotrichaceae bacterium]